MATSSTITTGGGVAAGAPLANCAPGGIKSSAQRHGRKPMRRVNTRRRIEGALFLVAFACTIPLANWLIGNVGATCLPNGPCLIPVAPGILAPSGVLAVGAALVLRDLVQR